MSNKKDKTTNTMEQEIMLLKRLYDLQSHPEGGWFAESWKGERRVIPASFAGTSGDRSCGTSCYYLLEEKNFLKWHKLCSDQLYYFHAGGRLKMHLLYKDGSHKIKILGNTLEDNDAQYHFLIPHGTWMGGEIITGDGYCMFACGVYPGFEYRDWTLGKTSDMVEEFPQHKGIIEKYPN